MNTSTATLSEAGANTPPDLLTGFLNRAEGLTGQWGERDCALWVAEWVEVQTGLDGGAEWRGTYSTEDECRDLLDREGGLLIVMARGARSAGLVRGGEPRRGDVGVVRVRAPGGRPEGLGGIFLGSGQWAAMSSEGLRVIRAEPLAVWTVP